MHHERCCPRNQNRLVLKEGPGADTPPMEVMTATYDPWAPSETIMTQQMTTPAPPKAIWESRSNVRYLSLFDGTLFDQIEMQTLLVNWLEKYCPDLAATELQDYKQHQGVQIFVTQNPNIKVCRIYVSSHVDSHSRWIMQMQQDHRR